MLKNSISMNYSISWTFNALKLRPRPHVSIFVWKRKFSGKTRIRENVNTVIEKRTFENRFPERKFLKKPFIHTPVWTDENGTFQKRIRHGMVSCTRFKMADGRMTCVAFAWTFFKPNSESWDQLSYAKRTSWQREGGWDLTSSGNFLSRSRRPVWNVFTENKTSKILSSPGRTSDWWDKFSAQVCCYRLNRICVFVRTGRKRLDNAVVWTEIF